MADVDTVDANPDNFTGGGDDTIDAKLARYVSTKLRIKDSKDTNKETELGSVYFPERNYRNDRNTLVNCRIKTTLSCLSYTLYS